MGQVIAAPVRRGPFGTFYGWWMVAIGSVITVVGSIEWATSTVFFLPLTTELHASRAQLSLVYSLAGLEGGLQGPVVGWVIDRFGPRVPLILGALLGGIGFLLLSTMHSYWGFLFTYLGLVSTGFQTGFLQCMHPVANSWFIRYRTRVMSIFSASMRLGPALFAPVMSAIVLSHGWRTGAAAAGILVLVITLPLALLIKRSPESMGLLPDGPESRPVPAAPTGAVAAVAVGANDFTLREALRTRSFWIIAFSTLVRLCTQVAISLHFVAIFVWRGSTQQTGANVVALLSAIAIPMILGMGLIGDRWPKQRILAVGQACVTVAILLLAFAHSFWAMALFAVLFAFGANTSPVNYSILGEFYGRKVFATLRGVLNVTNTLGIPATVFIGYVFDRTQSYAPALVTFSVLTAIAAVALLFVRRPERPARAKVVAVTS